MPSSRMQQEGVTPTGAAHLFGISRVEDESSLSQMLGGWFPGMEDIRPHRGLALVDRYGTAHVLRPGESTGGLDYPVHVLVPVTLPASMVKPASEARPYRR